MKRPLKTPQPVSALVSLIQASEPHAAPQSAWEAFDRDLDRQIAEFETLHGNWLKPVAAAKTRKSVDQSV